MKKEALFEEKLGNFKENKFKKSMFSIYELYMESIMTKGADVNHSEGINSTQPHGLVLSVIVISIHDTVQYLWTHLQRAFPLILIPPV